MRIDVRRFLMRLAAGCLLGCATFGIGCAARVAGDPLDGGDGGRTDGRTDARPTVDAERDVIYRDTLAYDVYREDACREDGQRSERLFDCDPFRPTTSCPVGQSCYPSIEYPDGRCGREIYRARCVPTGATPTNGFCTNTPDCAPGHGCFVTGSGNRCLRLCSLVGAEPSCPRGHVCEPTDLPEFGACD